MWIGFDFETLIKDNKEHYLNFSQGIIKEEIFNEILSFLRQKFEVYKTALDLINKEKDTLVTNINIHIDRIT